MNARRETSWNAEAVKNEVASIIRNSDFKGLVEYASQWGRELARGQQEASKAQIRKLFGEIKQIEMRWHRDPESSLQRLRMLKPRLAYAAARPNIGEGVARLRDVLTPAVDAVLEAPESERYGRFRTLVRLTEALLAYFTAAKGGR